MVSFAEFWSTIFILFFCPFTVVRGPLARHHSIAHRWESTKFHIHYAVSHRNAGMHDTLICTYPHHAHAYALFFLMLFPPFFNHPNCHDIRMWGCFFWLDDVFFQHSKSTITALFKDNWKFPQSCKAVIFLCKQCTLILFPPQWCLRTFRRSTTIAPRDWSPWQVRRHWPCWDTGLL